MGVDADDDSTSTLLGLLVLLLPFLPVGVAATLAGRVDGTVTDLFDQALSQSRPSGQHHRWCTTRRRQINSQDTQTTGQS